MLKNIKQNIYSILDQYALNVSSIDSINPESSNIYLIKDDASKKYALKLYEEPNSTYNDNSVQIYFLDAIAKSNMNLKVPEVVLNKYEESITKIELNKNEYRGILTTWLEGDAITARETESIYINLGVNLALLHGVTCNLELPSNIKPRKWDKVFYYKDEVSVFQKIDYQSILSKAFVNTLTKLIPVVSEKLKGLYKNTQPQLIHSDLNPWNIIENKGQLKIIDFEDVLLGLPIHDISNILFYYTSKSKKERDEILEYIKIGYSKVRAFPEVKMEDIEFLNIARTINFMNHALSLKEDHSEFINKAIMHISDYARKLI